MYCSRWVVSDMTPDIPQLVLDVGSVTMWCTLRLCASGARRSMTVDRFNPCHNLNINDDDDDATTRSTTMMMTTMMTVIVMMTRRR